MKDREFIELLNLYVDREISAQDALRLESEVIADPRRREIYDQYCRMQKACSMLSEDLLEATAGGPESNVVHFPGAGGWRFGQVGMGLAAAAAFAAVIVAFNYRMSSERYVPVQSEPVAVAKAAPKPLGLLADSGAMKPVFSTHVRNMPANPSRQRVSFETASAPIAELNWIGTIQMPPVFSAANSELLINPKTDIKAAGLVDTQDSQEPAEMAAFRFQR